jgi:hypothetical protein
MSDQSDVASAIYTASQSHDDQQNDLSVTLKRLAYAVECVARASLVAASVRSFSTCEMCSSTLLPIGAIQCCACLHHVNGGG